MNNFTRLAGFSPRRYAVVGAVLAILVSLSSAGSASAFTSPPFWKCRASAVWTSVADNNRVEPVLANGNPNTKGGVDPDHAQCVKAEAGANNLATPLGIPQSSVAAQSASAITDIDPEFGLALDQKVTSTAKVENLAIGGLGSPAIGVGAALSEAKGSCAAGSLTPVLTGTSKVTNITLGGQSASLDQLLDQLSKGLAPLGMIADLKVNEQVKGTTKDAESLIVRAVHLKVFRTAAPGGTPVVDLIVAETKVSVNGAACDPDKQFPFRVCPKGAVFEVTTSYCVIRETRDSNGKVITERIVVGRAFEGPSGGTVIPLTEARKKYNSPCLKGSGPQYAVIGTNKRDRITGTNRADRMLGLGGNDSLDGGRGNDCIDGGTGSDRETGGIGNDRVYGMSGKDTLTGNLGKDRIIGAGGEDHLNGGPGADFLDGGAGHDTIAAGYGADRVFGGAGPDFVNIAQQGPRATANCGSGRDKIRLNKKERAGVTNCEIQYVLQDK
jgi:hemolysin type calcium-binding protein